MACILQHVPLQQRLTSCALVCQLWAALAAAVPGVLDVRLKSTEHCQHLQDWLNKHGAVVVKLRARGPLFNVSDEWLRLQLPVQHLTHLRSLDLSWRLSFQLQLPAISVTIPAVGRSSLTGTQAAALQAAVAALLLLCCRTCRRSQCIHASCLCSCCHSS